MRLLDLINRIMHTQPTPPRRGTRVSTGGDLRAAHGQIARMRRDIKALDAAVRVAEARLRARGAQLPGD